MLGKIKQANNQNFYLVALDFDGQTTQSVYVLFIFFTVNCIMSLVNSPRLAFVEFMEILDLTYCRYFSPR